MDFITISTVTNVGGRDYWPGRMLAARDADHRHPLRSEDEGTEVFEYLRRLEEEQAAAK